MTTTLPSRTADRIAAGNSRPVTLEAFWDALSAFDWGFEFSDDHGVWTAGRTRLEELRSQATISDQHFILFEGFRRHHDARNYSRPNPPALPERPLPVLNHTREQAVQP